MEVASEQLIQDLVERIRVNINQAEKFNSLSEEKLNWRGAEGS